MAAIAADRNLLFGLLALQNGLINQGQLVAAFQAWTLDKARALTEHLISLGHLNDAQRAVIEAMADLHVAKHGDLERSLAAMPAGRSTRASLAQLGDADIGASIAQLGTGSTQAGEEDLDRTASYSVGTATSDGQRFRILRPHARGGLGAVFVALDTELHREVALKQILDDHADDPISRQRFLIEAEITGGLEHPGIVPVYGLGTYGDGRPYYAMRFVRGDSLKEAMEQFHADAVLKTDPGRRSLELRKLLRRFLDVCNAIDYAHSRGVLHRDIKPANVIVGKHGETLVLDWGLAKPMGRSDPGSGERTLLPSSSSGSSDTLPGSALGTPAYMSPEQAEGDLEHFGPRSDVYSLGATLYCLLTGQPPHTGDDAGAILRAVQRGEFRPPRTIDPSIDPALEAVCLKAMALKPEDRYGSPRALAEEVDRWMADEPVSAWREPLTRRSRRWARRNRTAMTAAGVALVAGIVGLAAVLAVQTRSKAELGSSLVRESQAKARLAAANSELARSKDVVQARYDLAVEAIKTFHTGVSEDFLLKEVTLKDLRNRLLKSAADFYGKLGALLGKETDAASRRALLQANYEVAELTGEVGGKEDALAAHRSVLAARQALAAGPGAEGGVAVEVGRSLVAVAGLLEATGQTAEALAEYRKSEGLLAALGNTDPSARAALADCRSRLGRLLSSTGKIAEALVAYRLARSEQEVLAGGPGALKEARRDLALTIHRIGLLLSDTGKPAEAEAEYRKALAIGQKLADDYPAVTEFRSRLALSHNNLGIVLSSTSKPAEAEAEYRKALAIGQKLADDYPAVTEFRGRLALSHINLGWLLSQSSKPAAAGVEYREALAIFRKLAEDNPSAPDYRDSAADVDNNLSVVLRRLGHPAEAHDHAEQAVAVHEVLVKAHPEVTRYCAGLAENHLNRGLARRALGEPVGAAADIRRAVSLYGSLPSTIGQQSFLWACCHAALTGLAGQAGSGVSAGERQSEAARAMALLHQAVAMGYSNMEEFRTDDALNPIRDRDDFRLLLMDLAMPADPFAARR
jgi:serine/threonine-protein kinase